MQQNTQPELGSGLRYLPTTTSQSSVLRESPGIPSGKIPRKGREFYPSGILKRSSQDPNQGNAETRLHSMVSELKLDNTIAV